MAQTQKVSGVKTTVTKTRDGIAVKYHNTTVAKLDFGKIVTLNSGGWKTATTKTRMNQFANEYCFGRFHVFQKEGEWFVSRGVYSPLCESVPFVDGMQFEI